MIQYNGSLNIDKRKNHETLNDYRKEPRRSGGRFLTSQKDLAHHGLGLESVQTTADK